MASRMNFLRLVLNFVVAGALLGIVVATVAGKKFLPWDNTTAQGKALCDCAETTRQTADRLIAWQLTGGASGAGLGAVAGVAFGVARRKKKTAGASSSTTAAT